MGSVIDKAQLLLAGDKSSSPTYAYEQLRFRLTRNVREFWSFLSAQLKSLEKDAASKNPQSLDSVQELYTVALQHKQFVEFKKKSKVLDLNFFQCFDETCG